MVEETLERIEARLTDLAALLAKDMADIRTELVRAKDIATAKSVAMAKELVALKSDVVHAKELTAAKDKIARLQAIINARTEESLDAIIGVGALSSVPVVGPGSIPSYEPQVIESDSEKNFLADPQPKVAGGSTRIRMMKEPVGE